MIECFWNLRFICLKMKTIRKDTENKYLLIFCRFRKTFIFHLISRLFYLKFLFTLLFRRVLPWMSIRERYEIITLQVQHMRKFCLNSLILNIILDELYVFAFPTSIYPCLVPSENFGKSNIIIKNLFY